MIERCLVPLRFIIVSNFIYAGGELVVSVSILEILYFQQNYTDLGIFDIISIVIRYR